MGKAVEEIGRRTGKAVEETGRRTGKAAIEATARAVPARAVRIVPELTVRKAADVLPGPQGKEEPTDASTQKS
ncbi:MAG: hypothetical protein GX111_11490 [Clostridiales bacterium]|nr:hypothetical protein [Clostridiales bacterium]